MEQAAFRDFTPLTEVVISAPPQVALETVSETEAAYCERRADEELARANAATHPAARAAHFEMAALHRERMLAGPITQR